MEDFLFQDFFKIIFICYFLVVKVDAQNLDANPKKSDLYQEYQRILNPPYVPSELAPSSPALPESPDKIANFEDLDLLGNFTAPKIRQMKLQKETEFIAPDFDYRVDKEKVRQVLLKRGTKIFHVKTGEAFKLPKNVYAQSYYRQASQEFQFLLDQTGKIQYLVFNLDVINLNEVTQLGARPNTFTVTEKKEEESYKVNEIDLRTQFNFLIETFNTNYLRAFNDRFEQGSGVGLAATLTNYLNWDLALKPGVAFQYKRGVVTYSDEDARIVEVYSLGPLFRYEIFQLLEWNWHTYFGVYKDLRHRATNRISKEYFNFSSNQLVLGLNLIRPQKYGKAMYGVEFKRQWLAYEPSENPQQAGQFTLDQSARNNTSWSIGLSFGLEFGVLL